MPTDNFSSKVLTLLFTDLEGSTTLKAQKGDDKASMLMARHRSLIKTIAKEESGRIIDWAGDGCFLTFEKPSSAVRFSLILIQAHENDSDLPNLRIGIHMGEVTEISGSDDGITAIKVEGLAVDIASRIQSLAMPGQILMSNAVFNSARQRLNSQDFDFPIAWRAHGAYLFKGLVDPIQLGEIGIDGVSPLDAPQSHEKAKRAIEVGEEQTLGWRPSPGLFIPGRPNWKLDSQLGDGGFGEVWLAFNINTHDKHVFKFCFQSDRLRGLKREVVLLRLLKETLGDREDIARVIDWNLNDQPYYIETEFTEGGNLKTWFEEQGGAGNVSIETRLDLVAQIATALSAAHSAGVLHKDIKPSNILIIKSKDNTKPSACLADFGIGLLTDPEALEKRGITSTGLTQTLIASKSSSGSGTALYMAPELYEGEAPTSQSDIYSLGVLLYQLVIGDFSRAISLGWEKNIDDELIKEDIALCAAGSTEHRLKDPIELANRLQSINNRRSKFVERNKRKALNKKIKYAGVFASILAIIIIFSIIHYRTSQIEFQKSWAYEKAIPEIHKLLEKENFVQAFYLAKKTKEIIPNDPTIDQYINESSSIITINLNEPEASVSYKPYSDVGGEWIQIDTNSLNKVRIPLGTHRWKIEKRGFLTREMVKTVIPQDAFTKNRIKYLMDMGFYSPFNFSFSIYKEDKKLKGMIRVDSSLFIPGLTGLPITPMKLDFFFIDRTEVTNKAYKEFINQGGYKNSEYWGHQFKRDGKIIEWEKAMKFFTDKTGQPGPSTWELGDYPAGQDNYPVSGLSWYEAAAYAKFLSKNLPSIYHWARAALPEAEIADPLTPLIAPMSNMEGKGPKQVGSCSGISANGVYDMAGNVREWCYNSSGENRYSLGGDWDDPAYYFLLPVVQSPWDRSEGNGFRCVYYPDGTKLSDSVLEECIQGNYEYLKYPPVSDEILKAYTNTWLYEKTPLNPIIESTQINEKGWKSETVTIDATYTRERIIIHMEIPIVKDPPYKVVIYFPGINSMMYNCYTREPYEEPWDCIPKSGRVLVTPVCSGMWERGGGPSINRLLNVHSFQKLIAEWVQDFGRTIDYLKGRPDIDFENIALLGFSLGAYLSPYLIVGEKRFRTAILQSGGFPFMFWGTEKDSAILVNSYLPRVKIPTLMLNGKYDNSFPLEKSQKPFFNRLGTPIEDKRHVVYEAGHTPLPRVEIIKEIIAWLDKYQGPTSEK